MKNFSTRYKVAIGYTLLSLLLITMVAYINSEMKQLTASDSYNHQLNIQRRAVNEIISRLNNTEIIGLAVAAGDLKAYKAYEKAIEHSYDAIDSLRLLLPDTLQQLRLDTVAMLMDQKKRNMYNLLSTISNDDADEIFKKQLLSIITQQDSLLESSAQRKIVRYTSSHTEPTKSKNFFKRLGEVFSPSKEDVTVVKDTIYEIYTDTAASSNAILESFLQDAEAQATDNHLQRQKKLNKEIQLLRIGSLQLSNKVQQLLNTIENESGRRMWQEQKLREEIRKKSAKTIGGIALLAVTSAAIFLFFIWRDITRSNHYRKELEKARKHAEELLKIREQLMLTITHDIKAPLSSILGYSELLGNIVENEREQFYLSNMQESAKHLQQLVTSLLDFYRLDADKAEAQNITFNAKELFDKIASAYTLSAKGKNTKFIYLCDNNLNCNFTGDPLRIRQITENLLSNAFKFTKEGEIILTAGIDDNKLSIRVSDTGCGITEEDKEKIFKEFTRLKNAQGEEGFGLGLAITHKLVTLLKGNIQIESKMGEGSTFNVEIPVTPGQQTVAMSEYEPEAKIRVLLIDDDSLQIQMTEAFLQSPRISVTACTQPDKVFDIIKDEIFDIIFTDIQMPGMNGIELITELHRRPCIKETPIVALTARDDIDNDTLTGYGFSGYLQKPFTRSAILKCIETATNNKKYDFSRFMEFSLDDRDASYNIMCTFTEETLKKRMLLSKAVEEGDLSGISNIAHQLLPIFKMVNAHKGLEELEWLDKQRNSSDNTTEIGEKAALVIGETDNIIAEAKESIKQKGTHYEKEDTYSRG